MLSSYEKYNPEDFIHAVTLDTEIASKLFRKLKSVALLIDTAKEIEDFQSIGVQCREILIKLSNYIYTPSMAGVDEQPKKSDFKNKAKLFIQSYLNGAENCDYRSIIKKLTNSTWDYACKITHLSTATFYEASTCMTLCISLVGAYENVMQKVFEPISQYECASCESKKLTIDSNNSDENGIVHKLYLKCEECVAITEVLF